MNTSLRNLIGASRLAVCLGLLPVPALLTPPAAAAPAAAPTKAPEPSLWSELGARATAQYTGDGLSISAVEGGAVLRCLFQRLEGEATSEGLWLTSTVTNTAQALERGFRFANDRPPNPAARMIHETAYVSPSPWG